MDGRILSEQLLKVNPGVNNGEGSSYQFVLSDVATLSNSIDS